MRFLALALFLLSAFLPLAAQAGEWDDPLPGWPTPPQIVDPALGLPSPWRYIDGEGRSNSPCLGEISTPACLYDTMVACGSWTPKWDKLKEGSPGYPYGPDWIGGLHPLCDPLRWTPIEGYVARQEEPLGIHYQSLVDPPENRVFFYRVYAFPVDGVVVGESPDVHSLMRRVGDIVVVGIHYFCDEEVAARFRWEELIADDPHPETLWRRLPESCDEWTNTIAHVMRKHDMGWWVVNVTWMRMGAGSVPTWGPAYNFYLSKRK